MTEAEGTAPLPKVHQPLQLLKIYFLYVSCFLGFSAIFLFIWYNNSVAAVNSYTLAIVCAIHLAITRSARRGRLYTYTRAKMFLYIASWTGMMAFGSVIVHMVLGITYEQGFQLENRGHYAVTIICSLTLLWSISLAFDMRSYMSQFTGDKLSLLESADQERLGDILVELMKRFPDSILERMLDRLLDKRGLRLMPKEAELASET